MRYLVFIILELLRVNEGRLVTLEGSEIFETGNWSAPIQTWSGLWRILRKSNASPLSLATSPEAIRFYGYPVETHKVQTEDGYILTLHRIPWGKGQKSIPKRRRPVLLQHGLFASSFEWLMNTPDKLLALQLADNGYDVFLGNVRGNAYSRGHVSLSPSNREFWEFSMHEMGKYDLPATIDYVLRTTQEEQIRYVGYSLGTTMFWIMMSLRPEYNEKVKLMTGLAPVGYINNMRGFPRIALAPFEKQLKALMDFFFHGEFLPPWFTRLYNRFGTKFCSNTFIAETFCANINFMLAGWNLPQTQISRLPLFYGHTPSPMSTRTLSHISQFINTGVFQEYDFGLMRNIRHYGRLQPRKYFFNRTKVPTVLLWGLNDAVIEPIDVERVVSELPNVLISQPVNNSLWSHFDYHLARDVNELVNQPVLKIMEEFI